MSVVTPSPRECPGRKGGGGRGGRGRGVVVLSHLKKMDALFPVPTCVASTLVPEDPPHH